MAQNVDQTKQQTENSLDSTFESIIIDIPQSITFSSASSSSYDTDSSVNSATCCTKHHNEHIYMQRPVVTAAPVYKMAGHELGASHDLEAVYFKAEQHRKNWPIFILMISLLEVSFILFSELQNYKKIFFIFLKRYFFIYF